MIAAVVVIVVVLLVILAAVLFLSPGRGPLIPGRGPDGGERPSAQPKECADVQFLSVPGTWESREGDDPYAPTANPHSLLLGVTGPLGAEFAGRMSAGPGGGPAGPRLDVRTVAYPAQFKNPQPGNADSMTYDESRRKGTEALSETMAATNRHCPLTRFVLVGFSQGAVIVGDVAAAIGTGGGPVTEDLVLGAVAIADGRRQPGVGRFEGTPIAGVGAEVVLQPFAGLTAGMGATMTGPRAGGFGALNERVVQICAPGDLICDAPANVGELAGRLGEIIQGNDIHARYATNPAVFPGSTTLVWVVNWARGLVDGAPATPRTDG